MSRTTGACAPAKAWSESERPHLVCVLSIQEHRPCPCVGRREADLVCGAKLAVVQLVVFHLHQTPSTTPHSDPAILLRARLAVSEAEQPDPLQRASVMPQRLAGQWLRENDSALSEKAVHFVRTEP